MFLSFSSTFHQFYRDGLGLNSLIFRRSLQSFISLILVFLLIITSGCSPKNLIGNTDKTNQLVLPISSDPPTFNYAVNTTPYSIFSYLYTGLLRLNGLTGEIQPSLAESWEISPDRTQIIFTLREGLQWSDGFPLSADDVVFTYNQIYLNPKIPSVWKDFLKLGNQGKFPVIKKLDSTHIEFTLPEPFAPFLRYITRLAVLPSHKLLSSVISLDESGNPKFISTWGTNTPPQEIISNGPYKLINYTPGERLILENNPYYWRKDNQGNNLPYIKRIVVTIIESSDNQLLRFRSGELDSISVSPQSFSLLKREEKRGKFTIYNGGPLTGISFISFNLNQARNKQEKPFVDPIKSRWFNNLSFRQAVAYSINRERINNNIYRGLGAIQHSVLAVQSPYYLSPEEGLKIYDYDPNKAKQILLQEGFKYNNKNQLLDQDGNQVQFNILVKSEDKSRIDITIQIQEDLQAIGIKTNLETQTLPVILQRLLARRDWECYVGAFGVQGSEVEPNLLSLFWTSKGSFHQFNQGPQPRQAPIINWVVSDWEKQIDRLFLEGLQTLDEDKRKKIYGEFQQVVAEQLPIFCLVNSLLLQAIRNSVKNVQFSALGGAFWNIDELKIEE